MSRDLDYKIDKWLGHFVWPETKSNLEGHYCNMGNFTTCDADALTLLPVLAKKGYTGNLDFGPNGYDFAVTSESWGRKLVAQPTIAAAISGVVLELIDATMEQ